MKPKISILMTIFNGGRFLEETLNSILEQDFKNYEIVIVDDGSTDATSNIIHKFALDNKVNLSYYYYGENQGYENIHNVLNFGLDKCKGKYICKFDCDDLMEQGKLRIQSEYLDKHPDIFLCGSSAYTIDEHGNKAGTGKFKKRSYPSSLIALRLLKSNCFIHSSIMFRNEGFKYQCQHEHLFYLWLIIHGKKLKNLPHFLVSYRMHPYGMMADADLTNNKFARYFIK